MGDKRISDIAHPLSEIIADLMPDIKDKAISTIENEIYKVVGNSINYDERRLVAAKIFKSCITMGMSISDDYSNMVGEISRIINQELANPFYKEKPDISK